MAITNQIANWVKKIADKVTTTELPKVPRWWGTEMSPVSNSDWNRIFMDNLKRINEIRDWRWEDPKPLEVLRDTPIWAIPAAAGYVADIASIPVNTARNLYNTAADVANAKIAEHNAKAIQRKANTRKWVLMKKAEPKKAISISL